jgi:hypothetical protein
VKCIVIELWSAQVVLREERAAGAKVFMFLGWAAWSYAVWRCYLAYGRGGARDRAGGRTGRI